MSTSASAMKDERFAKAVAEVRGRGENGNVRRADQANEALEKEICLLHETIEVLTGRLSPALKPSDREIRSGQGEGVPAGPGAISPLVSRIEDHRHQVVTGRMKIQGLIDDLEL